MGEREGRHRATSVPWSAETAGLLRRLDPSQSRVLTMIYFDRFSEQEVAERLSVPRLAVARTASAGLQALASLMLAMD
jgi:DNA-directed RNA polymerase specialized sigma24 family protein